MPWSLTGVTAPVGTVMRTCGAIRKDEGGEGEGGHTHSAPVPAEGCGEVGDLGTIEAGLVHSSASQCWVCGSMGGGCTWYSAGVIMLRCPSMLARSSRWCDTARIQLAKR